jgi:predicted transcriptional regulator
MFVRWVRISGQAMRQLLGSAKRLEFSNAQIGSFLGVSAAAVSIAATKGALIARAEGVGANI